MPVVCSLSPELQQFLRQMQRLRFGRIERVVLRGGIPLHTPAPFITRERKFCTLSPVAEDADLDSYCQRPAVSEFIEEVGEIGDGEISCLEVRHGVPFRILVSRSGFPGGNMR